MRVTLKGEQAMQALGAALAATLRTGDTIWLDGPLGAGKTSLARGIIAGLGYDQEVPSPSFAIVQYYEPPALRLPLAHADFYRLQDPEEALELGLDQWRDEGVLLAEWPQSGGLMPDRQSLQLQIAMAGDSARHVTAVPGPDWLARMDWFKEQE